MSILSAIPVIGNIFDKATDIIDKFAPHKNLAAKILQEHTFTLLTTRNSSRD